MDLVAGPRHLILEGLLLVAELDLFVHRDGEALGYEGGEDLVGLGVVRERRRGLSDHHVAGRGRAEGGEREVEVRKPYVETLLRFAPDILECQRNLANIQVYIGIPLTELKEINKKMAMGEAKARRAERCGYGHAVSPISIKKDWRRPV